MGNWCRKPSKIKLVEEEEYVSETGKIDWKAIRIEVKAIKEANTGKKVEEPLKLKVKAKRGRPRKVE